MGGDRIGTVIVNIRWFTVYINDVKPNEVLPRGLVNLRGRNIISCT